MDGFLSKKTVQSVVDILESSKRRKKMVGNNYGIAARHYSYSILRNQLSAVMKSFFGDEIEQLTAKPKPAKSRGYLYINSQQVRYKHFNSKGCTAPNSSFWLDRRIVKWLIRSGFKTPSKAQWLRCPASAGFASDFI
jgi:hypothetical protein